MFYFNDPACVGYGLMREADFNRRWIDMDAAGTIYDHYGIEIDESGSAYDPQACSSWSNPNEPGISIRFDTQEKERIVFREGDPKRMERKLNQSAQIATQARAKT